MVGIMEGSEVWGTGPRALQGAPVKEGEEEEFNYAGTRRTCTSLVA